MSLIEMRGLAKRYGELEALGGVDLEVPAGAVFGLLGPNGAGKTTLLNLLFGLTPATAGEIRVGGRDLRRDLRAVRAGMGYVPQHLAFYPSLSGRRNLEIFAGVLGLRGSRRHARVAACIELTGLERYAERRSADYSGGLKRRLNLAIGLLNEPRILCLDEPTVGIDPQSRGFLLGQFQALNRTGVTLIYCSHYMDEVQQICSHVAVLDRGRVLVSGPLESLLHGGEQVIEIGLAPGSRVPETCLAGVAAVREGDLLRLAAGTPLAALAVLLGRLAGQGIEVTHLSYGRRNLEDLFMALTNRSLRD